MPSAFVLINVDLGKEKDVLGSLSQIKEVKEAHRLYGVYDSLAKIEAASERGIKETVGRIRSLPNVRSTVTIIVVG